MLLLLHLEKTFILFKGTIPHVCKDVVAKTLYSMPGFIAAKLFKDDDGDDADDEEEEEDPFFLMSRPKVLYRREDDDNGGPIGGALPIGGAVPVLVHWVLYLYEHSVHLYFAFAKFQCAKRDIYEQMEDNGLWISLCLILMHAT